MGYLSLLVFLPLLSLPLLWLRQQGLYRWVAVATAALQLVLLLVIYPTFTSGSAVLSEKLRWLTLSLGDDTTLHIHYELVMDGISYVMCLLSSVVMLTAALASWQVTERLRLYYGLFQLLNASLIGTFLAQDLVLFYIFYELMLLPMFFLIGIWGSKRREYAAVKFFLYTLLGSLLLLLVIVGLVYSYGPHGGHYDFSLSTFANLNHLQAGTPFADMDVRTWAFWGMFIAFAVKLPIVPLHTWLPDAHVEANTPISVVLAGVLLKVGGYGLIRFLLPIFPDVFALNQEVLMAIAVISILYGGLVALGQQHLKRLVAYSSVAHMGFVLLGVASLNVVGMQGAVLQLFTHGTISALLFLVAGVLSYRTHDLAIAHYRGLWRRMPAFAFFAALGMFAGLGLPGLSAFISEVLIFNGAFAGAAAGSYSYWYAGLGLGGILLSAAYLLWAFQRLFLGEFASPYSELPDLNRGEWQSLLLPALLTVLVGILPFLLLQLYDTNVRLLLEQARQHMGL